jgi:type II restriction enzyme
VICDFCGYLAQVKAMSVRTVDDLPRRVLGAAWGPQKERMDSAIYFPLFLVLRSPNTCAIYYLPTDFQSAALFVARNPLSDKARRKGWQGFTYALDSLPAGAFVRLL